MFDEIWNATSRVIAVAWWYVVGSCSAIAGQGDPERSLRPGDGGWAMKGLTMIAACTPDGFPQLIAQNAEASIILDKPRAGYAMLILVVRKSCGQELRFPLGFHDVRRIVFFVDSCLENPDQFSGRLTGNLLLIYEARQFEIRRRLQKIMMSPRIAEDLVDALREYAV